MTFDLLLLRMAWFLFGQAVTMACSIAASGADVTLEAVTADGTRVFRVQTDTPLTFTKDGITYRLSFGDVPPGPDPPTPPPPPDSISEAVRKLTAAVDHPAKQQTASDLATVYGSIPQILDALNVSTTQEARQFEEAGFQLVVTAHGAAAAWSPWWTGVSARLSPLSFADYRAATGQVAHGLTAAGVSPAAIQSIASDERIQQLEKTRENRAAWADWYERHPDQPPNEAVGDLGTVRRKHAELGRQIMVLRALRGEVR